MTFAEDLERALPGGTAHRPGTTAYGDATSPDNNSFPQPDLLVRPLSGTAASGGWSGRTGWPCTWTPWPATGRTRVPTR